MITVTESAVKEIRNIIAQQDNNGFHLRLGIGGGGCAGFQYFLGLDSEIHESDEAIDYEGFKMLVDKQALPFLNGSVLDFSGDPEKAGFIFTNPNAPKPSGCDGSCSC